MSRKERRTIDALVQENKDLKQFASLLQFMIYNNVATRGAEQAEILVEEFTVGQALYSLGISTTEVEELPAIELPDILSVRIHDLIERIKLTGYLK